MPHQFSSSTMLFIVNSWFALAAPSSFASNCGSSRSHPDQYLVRWSSNLFNTQRSPLTQNSFLGPISSDPKNELSHNSGSNEIKVTLHQFRDESEIENFKRLPGVLSIEPDCDLEITQKHWPQPLPSALTATNDLISLSRTRPAGPQTQQSLSTLPNDPLLPQQWHLTKISAPEAWSISEGVPEIIVSVNDSGIDFSHEDLSSNLWINRNEIAANGIDDDGNGCVDDIHGCNNYSNTGDTQKGALSYYHGTHVAGIIGAVSNNAKGIAGVAPRIRLMDSQAFPFDGPLGGSSLRSTMLKSIYYSVNNGAKVINCSWSTQDNITSADRDAFDFAEKHGVIVVVAAGNDKVDVAGHFPMGLSTVIPVAATDHLDQISTFSNFGDLITFAAPGGQGYDSNGKMIDGILSTVPMNQGGYALDIGTSMAAPQVSGLIALIWSMNSKWSKQNIIDFLKNGADKISVTPANAPKSYAYLRINMAKTLYLVKNSIPSSTSTAPTTTTHGGSSTTTSMLTSTTTTATNSTTTSTIAPPCDPQSTNCKSGGTGAGGNGTGGGSQNHATTSGGSPQMPSCSSTRAPMNRTWMIDLLLWSLPLLNAFYLKRKFR